MPPPITRRNLLLIAAMLVPLMYFGAQAVAAPYYPNYSVFKTSASALGSDLSSRPGILNTGAFLTGVLAWLGSLGFVIALPRIGVGKVSAYLLALCLFSGGLASFWASQHPLPDPRHNPGALGLGLFLMPFVAAWVSWRMRAPRAVRFFLLLNAAAFVALGLVMSGFIGVDLAAFGGLVQKLIAATAWMSSAVIALAALKPST